MLAAKQEELSVDAPKIPKESEEAIAADDSALPQRKTKNFKRGQSGRDLAALLAAQQQGLTRKDDSDLRRIEKPIVPRILPNREKALEANG